MSNTITGPLWAARNWAADAGAGSIHDDATAAELGFRGGTIPGDAHMNQFPPVLLRRFGQVWFERGNLSLAFKVATIEGERVQVISDAPTQPDGASAVRMVRDDGMLAATGSASIGQHDHSALRSKDFRACDPAELRILNRIQPGQSLGEYAVHTDPAKQFQRFDDGLISDPLDWYRGASPWGEPVAAPSTVLEFLWAPVMSALTPLVDESVGLFGAIEIGFHAGPLLMNRDYRITSRVLCVGQSPQTEYLWYEMDAFDPQGTRVACLLLQSRAMKASSVHYSDDA